MRESRGAAGAAFLLVTLATYVFIEVIISFKNGTAILTRQNAADVLPTESTEQIDDSLQILLSMRVCGSPAIDGYSHVEPECLKSSPTAQWWLQTQPTPDDLVIHIEREADYDGLAVAWGIDNKMMDVEECAEACRQHIPNPDDELFGSLPCNSFVFCRDEVCFEPDAHKHTKGDCWLKFTEGPASPEVNMRGRLSADQRGRHATAPDRVQWDAGVLLPRGVDLLNGTWSPRYYW